MLSGSVVGLVALALGRPRLLWASAVDMCLILTVFWAWDVIPEHAEDMSAGRWVQEFEQLAQSEGAELAAYRGQWDAASFYHGGEELRVFSSRHPRALRAFVEEHPRTLILVRRGVRDD